MRDLCGIAVLGLLAGAAGLATGEGSNEELLGKLRELERVAAAAAASERPPTAAPAVEDGMELEIFPIADLAAGLAPFPYASGVSDAAWGGWGCPSGEEILERLRSFTDPGLWERGFAQVHGQSVFVLNTPRALDEVRRCFDGKLRPAHHRCVNLDLQLMDVPEAIAAGLASGERTAVELPPGDVVFRGRAIGYLGQRFHLLHGSEIAALSGVEVEVAQSALTADPQIGTLFAGARMTVRASAGVPGGAVTLDLDFRWSDVARPLDRREAHKAGILEMPVVTEYPCVTSLAVADHSWACATAGQPRPGVERLLLVRPTVLERKGSGR